jgi:preprotein translocase subunit SecB
MKPSPIQLLDSVFEEISIEVNPSHAPKAGGPVLNDIHFEISSGCEPLPDFWAGRDVPMPGIDARTFVVNLAIRTAADQNGNYPYTFRVRCAGVVACIREQVSANLSAEAAAQEYGLSLLYGMVRDLVLQCTARMAHSSWMLPTVSFMGDSKREAKQRELALESPALLANETDGPTKSH